MVADFSGYATVHGLKCSDGRTIMPGAFKHNDKMRVPLVWQHQHNEPFNVLGHAILEHRAKGVYAYGFFNDTEAATQARTLVQHEDVNALSIYANNLTQQGMNVLHGDIRELSLVLSGANPGAFIDYVNLSHDSTSDATDGEAIIYTGLTLEHEDRKEETMADAAEKTVKDVFDSLTEEQKNVVYFMIGEALDGASGDETVEQSGLGEDLTDTLQHENQEGYILMPRNVFEQNGPTADAKPTLTHDQLATIVTDAKKMGSFKESFLAHAVEYGIENIDYLFPDARTLASSPEMITRRQEWVSGVLSGTKKSPFSRIKTVSSDLTLDDARAKGYVKGSLKKEEWFALQKRTTTPTTIYKKQKLDRDDIIDITDLDVVAWLKAEMRIMLDEEIARAVLVGDGRQIDDDDKIDESHIRPIAYEDDFYAHKVIIAANTTGDAIVEAILRARPNYRGKGNPACFLTEGLLTDMLLVKDKMGRRLYASLSELESTMRVSKIVTVPVMESLSTAGGDLIAILVNLDDYTMGADKGGNISMFDDFDIDYNQYKYLIETRLSGALTGFKTALVISRAAGTLVTPAVPTFVPATGVVTIPATTGVVYTQDDTVRTAGAQEAVAAGVSTEVVATPATGYYFPHNFDADWLFTRNA